MVEFREYNTLDKDIFEEWGIAKEDYQKEALSDSMGSAAAAFRDWYATVSIARRRERLPAITKAQRLKPVL